jgi:hypothetical protein
MGICRFETHSTALNWSQFGLSTTLKYFINLGKNKSIAFLKNYLDNIQRWMDKRTHGQTG